MVIRTWPWKRAEGRLATCWAWSATISMLACLALGNEGNPGLDRVEESPLGLLPRRPGRLAARSPFFPEALKDSKTSDSSLSARGSVGRIARGRRGPASPRDSVLPTTAEARRRGSGEAFAGPGRPRPRTPDNDQESKGSQDPRGIGPERARPTLFLERLLHSLRVIDRSLGSGQVLRPASGPDPQRPGLGSRGPGTIQDHHRPRSSLSRRARSRQGFGSVVAPLRAKTPQPHEIRERRQCVSNSSTRKTAPRTSSAKPRSSSMPRTACSPG